MGSFSFGGGFYSVEFLPGCTLFIENLMFSGSVVWFTVFVQCAMFTSGKTNFLAAHILLCIFSVLLPSWLSHISFLQSL